jgi:Zn-finger nucleic acid-binding protein
MGVTLVHTKNDGEISLPCPVCTTPLKPAELAGRRMSVCDSCRGRLINAAVAKSLVGKEFVRVAFVDSGIQSNGRLCPSCSKPMVISTLRTSLTEVELDICKSCQVLWFDQGELSENSSEPIQMTDLSIATRNKMSQYNVYAATNLLLNKPQQIGAFSRARTFIRKMALGLFGIFIVGQWIKDGHFFPKLIVFTNPIIYLSLLIIWTAPYMGNYVGYGLRSRLGLVVGIWKSDPMAFVNRSTPPVILELFGIVAMTIGVFFSLKGS